MDWLEYKVDGDGYVPMDQWGKDHWSTLLYLETRAVDGGGVIENLKVRCDARLHREFADMSPVCSIVTGGKKYPTRLRGNGEIINHDDWSCLEDMVAEGLIEAWYRVKHLNRAFANSIAKIKLTELGWWIVGQLRIHKANGGKLAAFCPELP